LRGTGAGSGITVRRAALGDALLSTGDIACFHHFPPLGDADVTEVLPCHTAGSFSDSSSMTWTNWQAFGLIGGRVSIKVTASRLVAGVQEPATLTATWLAPPL